MDTKMYEALAAQAKAEALLTRGILFVLAAVILFVISSLLEGLDARVVGGLSAAIIVPGIELVGVSLRKMRPLFKRLDSEVRALHDVKAN